MVLVFKYIKIFVGCVFNEIVNENIKGVLFFIVIVVDILLL